MLRQGAMDYINNMCMIVSLWIKCGHNMMGCGDKQTMPTWSTGNVRNEEDMPANIFQSLHMG